MTMYSIGAAEVNERRQSDFAEFLSIVKGRSIISAADWGNERIELGLSGGAMIRFFGSPINYSEVNLIQTTNPGELPPILISLGDMPQRVPLATVEKKLRGLRTLYAIFFFTTLAGSKNSSISWKKTPMGILSKAFCRKKIYCILSRFLMARGS